MKGLFHPKPKGSKDREEKGLRIGGSKPIRDVSVRSWQGNLAVRPNGRPMSSIPTLSLKLSLFSKAPFPRMRDGIGIPQQK
ncbi:hypothetical protein Csa_005262 [Cucumis sativus]|uniref:Uncharacterized protein n=1 Tax=Cucumis sativus TaxID=3659 RepID=A0A0A0KDU9_CUCSA|nr:hypothetical protein Csa_005262 [Cucumis sativus]